MIVRKHFILRNSSTNELTDLLIRIGAPPIDACRIIGITIVIFARIDKLLKIKKKTVKMRISL